MNSPLKLNLLSLFSSLLILSGGLIATPSAVQAQVTVSWSGYDAQFMPSTGASNLANGSLVRMGTFDLSGPFDFNLIGTPGYSTFNEVDAFFAELSSLFTGEYSGEQGTFQQLELELDVATETPDTPLYIWAFNNSIASDATQWGIVGGNAAPTSQWSVPDTFPGSHAFDIGDEFREIHFGSDSGIVSPLSRFDSTNVRLAAIPEPSTFLLIALALAAVGIFRMRSSVSRDS